MQRLDFRGKVALITGGSRGLGFLLARELSSRGCRVAICGRDRAALDWAAAQLGSSVLTQQTDVGRREEMDQLVAEVQRQLGPIDILVNNAGIMDVGPLQAMHVEDFQRAMDVMFWAALYSTLAIYPSMIQRGGGSIVNITSIGGSVSVPHMLPYACAKFAAVGLSEGLVAGLSQYGIRVTTVLPGLMRTGSHINATVRSNQAGEFGWFAFGASAPLLSMDAERAARQIVRAVEWGLPELTLSLPANLLRLIHGLAPGLTSLALSVVNRLLPKPSGQPAIPGKEVRTPALLEAATTLGRASASRFQPPA